MGTKGNCKYTKETCKFAHPADCREFGTKPGCRRGDKCSFRHLSGAKSGTATPAAKDKTKAKSKKDKKAKSPSASRSQSPKGSNTPKKKSRSQRRAASRARAAGGTGAGAHVAVGGFVGLASAIVGVTNGLLLCSDSIAMKLEKCSNYTPGLYSNYATDYQCAGVYDFTQPECENMSYIADQVGSECQSSHTVYKHANNICTYADSPNYACGEY